MLANEPEPLKILAKYDSHEGRTSYSLSCPHCRFRNSWGSEQTALTKVAEHLQIKHGISLSIPRNPSSVRVTNSFEEFLRSLGIPLSSSEISSHLKGAF